MEMIDTPSPPAVRKGQQWQRPNGEILLILGTTPQDAILRILESPDTARIGKEGRLSLAAFARLVLHAEPPPEPKVSLARLYKVMSALGDDPALSPEFRALLGPLRVLTQHLAVLQACLIRLVEQQSQQDAHGAPPPAAKETAHGAPPPAAKETAGESAEPAEGRAR